mmetsp:Transcript_36284/g.62853  ORF Transcript_36284/g.62853 Transcript_36284/m.62853 type:complete len:141 (+) Transcript_36284:109-531(+)
MVVSTANETPNSNKEGKPTRGYLFLAQFLKLRKEGSDSLFVAQLFQESVERARNELVRGREELEKRLDEMLDNQGNAPGKIVEQMDETLEKSREAFFTNASKIKKSRLQEILRLYCFPLLLAVVAMATVRTLMRTRALGY